MTVLKYLLNYTTTLSQQSFKLARTEPLNEEAVPHTKKPQGTRTGEQDGQNKKIKKCLEVAF